MLETFAVGEIRKQLSWLEEPALLGHWRVDDDVVDVVVEFEDGRVLGFEVKANQRVSGKDLGGLRKLRDSLGSRFVGGVALATYRQLITPRRWLTSAVPTGAPTGWAQSRIPSADGPRSRRCSSDRVSRRRRFATWTEPPRLVAGGRSGGRPGITAVAALPPAQPCGRMKP